MQTLLESNWIESFKDELKCYISCCIGKFELLQYDIHYIGITCKNRMVRILLSDRMGSKYDVLSVIASEDMTLRAILDFDLAFSFQESETKTEKLLNKFNLLREKYPFIHSSIAILAGSWSMSSRAMMRSHDINLFIIPFETITSLLKKYQIKFDWGEKDREVAVESWEKYQKLTDEQKRRIAEEMIAEIKPDLESAIEKTLDNSTKRVVEKVSLEIHTNIGEVRRFEFNTVEDALDFLEDFSFDEILNNDHSFTLFDKPEMGED